MRRRELVAALAAGTAGVLAGCSGGSEPATPAGTATGTTTTEATEATTAPRERAAALIAEGERSLSEATDRLAAESDRLEGSLDGVDLQVEPIEAALDTARDRFEAAREYATADQQNRISELLATVEWVRALTGTVDATADGLNDLGTAFDYYDDDRYEDAAESSDAAQEDLETAESELAVARDRFDSLEAATVEESDRVDLAEAREGMEQVGDAVEALVVLAEGYEPLSRGIGAFLAGANALDDGDLDAAIDSFDTAREQSSRAHDTFRNGEDEVAPAYRSDVIDLTCLSGAFEDAADSYAAGCRALRDGDDSTAEDRFAEGQEALERCDTGETTATATDGTSA